MEKKRALIYLNLIFCVISITLVYILLPFGVNTCDEPCLILQTRSSEINHLVPLSYLLSNTIASVFNYHWITYRAISVGVFVVTILISCLYFYIRIGKTNRTLFLCWTLLLVYALQKDNWYSIYGYDCYSVMCTTIFAIAALNYIKKPDSKILIFLGFISAINVFFRFPNITGIPLMVALIIARNIINKEKSASNCFKQILIYIIVTIVIFTIVCVLLFGSLNTYIDQCVNLKVKGHGSNIIEGYIYHFFINIIPYIAYIVSLYFLFILVDRQNLNLKIKNALRTIILIFAVLEFVVLWRLLFLSKLLFIVSVCMALILYAALNNRKGLLGYLSITFLFTCGFITALGSNGGLCKYMVFSIVPLIAVYLEEPKLSFDFSAMTLYLSILAISVFALKKGTFVDAGLAALNTQINHPNAYGLLTTESKGRMINEAISDFGEYPSIDSIEITVIGNNRSKYIYDYIFDCQNPHLKDVWDDADYYNDDSTVKLIKDDILKTTKPYYIFYLKDKSNSKMEAMLDGLEMKSKETETYIVFEYIPK